MISNIFLKSFNIGDYTIGVIKKMWDTLLIAFALMLVLEGILPFLFPNIWRDTFKKLTETSDNQVRFIGLTSMLLGIALLYLVK